MHCLYEVVKGVLGKTQKVCVGDSRVCFVKDVASKMHTEGHVGLVRGGDVGDGFLGEASIQIKG